MPRMRRLAASLVALATLVASGAASAREEPRVLVRFAPQLAGAEATRLTSAMRAQLRDTATVITSGEGAESVGVVDVDRTEAGLILRFADRSGNPLGPPRVVAHGGEIGASEAAAIVRAFVVAGIEEAAPAPAPSVAPPPAAAPPPPLAPSVAPSPSLSAEVPAPSTPAPAAPWRARLGAFYTGSTYASQLPWQSGARIEAVYAFAPRVYVGAGYAFHPATELTSDAAAVRATRHAAQLFVGAETRGRAFALGADLGAGFDDALRSTTRTAAPFTGTSDAAHVTAVFVLRGHARLRVPQVQGFALDVAPALELAPGSRSLVVEDGEATATLLSPAIARLRLDVGGTFDGF